MAKKNTQPQAAAKRSPVVVVMGHVDHGKSTLLDYIRTHATESGREVNTVDGEAGGITQHTAAYEVAHKPEGGDDERITFIDTPGHAAFNSMRARGAHVADIAVLVVAADDGVKEQTKEALNIIKAAELPYIVAINKIDKPNASPEGTKQSLAENEVFVEGYGGDISSVNISAKTGEGITELLDLLVLATDLEEYKSDQSVPATGVVIESHTDARKGNTATLVMTNGTIKKGMCIAIGPNASAVRALYDFSGKQIDFAVASSPIVLMALSGLPAVGDTFETFDSKKDAQTCAEAKQARNGNGREQMPNTEIVIPVILKADVAGTLEALVDEVSTRSTEEVGIHIIYRGVGDISESDVKLAQGANNPVIIGFHVGIDKHAADSSEKMELPVKTSDIIYELTQWLEELVVKRTPENNAPEVLGSLKILKTFSASKKRQVVGGRVEEGVITVNKTVHIKRDDEEIGTGKITNLQQGKADSDEVAAGNECGLMIESKSTIVVGDILEYLSR